MRETEFRSMLDRLAAGWTERAYEAVAAHFADGVYYSDAVNYAFRDRESLLRFFRDDEDREQSCVFHDAIFDEGRQVGAAEYTYSGSYRYHGTVWIKLVNDKIASWREYQHKSEKDWEEFWKHD